MIFLLDKIKQLKIGWNERPLGEADFYKLCKRHKIVVNEMPLRVSGFYYCVKGGHYIAIDSKLSKGMKLLVMFHEFAHFLMHAPSVNETASYHGIGRKDRKEIEADTFALVAVIPQKWIETMTPDEILERSGLDADQLKERFEIFEKFGI